MKTAFLAPLALGLACGLASAQFWPTVTTSTNMGTFSTYNIANLTNGSGLSSMTPTATHSATWQDMWISNSITTGWVEFDLGSPQLVRTIALWNYNASFALGRGVAVMDVSVGLTTANYALLSRETPPRGTGNPILAHLIQVNRPARYIKFDIIQNHGDASYTGMSEVQFVIGGCAGRVGIGGTGCRDAGGTPNTLNLNGCPDRGTTPTLQMNVSPSATHPLLLIAGLSDQNWGGVPLPFSLGVIGAPSCFIYTSQTLVIGAFPPTNGVATHPLPIPQGNHLLGATLYFQFLNFELTLTPQHISTSDYLTIVIG